MNSWETPPAGAAATIAACLAAQVPTLETARLRLRAPRIEDFADYAGVVMSARGVHVGGPMEREAAWLDFAQMVAGWLLRGHGLWTIERLEDGALVGFLPLNHEFGDDEPEIGFLLTAAAEGRGYAREAAEAARRFAWDRLALDRLVSYVAPENARSIRVATGLGAIRDGATEDGVLVFRHVRGRA